MLIFDERKKGILSDAIIFLVLYSFWGFIFTKTVFSNSLVVYVAFLGMMGIFLFLLFRERTIICNQGALYWIPFLLYTILSLFIQGDIEFLCYWSVCLIIVLISQKTSLYRAVPYKLLVLSGIVAIVGQAIQLFLPAVYNSVILPLFTNQMNIKYWATTYGLAGFTYQLDVTAMMIIVAEAVIFSFSAKTIKGKMPLFTKICVIITIIAVFLSGKRMLSLISIIVPIFVYLISQKKASKKIGVLLVALVFLFFAMIYFSNNIDTLYNSRFFYRFANTFISLKSNSDITTGRTSLYALAIEVFKQHPVFGVGVGKFIAASGSETAVHNTYLQVLCEQGIVGIVMYIIPLLTFLLNTIKLVRNTKEDDLNMRYYKFSLFFQLIYIMYAMTENVNVNMFGYVIYFLVISIYLSAKYEAHLNITY